MSSAAHPKSEIRVPKSPLRSPAALARFFLTAAVGIALDLWIKVWSFKTLALSHTRGADGRLQFVSAENQFIPGWLHFKVTANYGAVFGIGQGQRWLFLGVSLAAVVFLVALFRASRQMKFYQFILGMLLAGVVGNAYDRVRFGFVRDMIYALPDKRWFGTWTLFGYPGPERYVFPWIFNIADSLLCVGVGFMLVYSLFGPARPEGRQAVPAPVADG